MTEVFKYRSVTKKIHLLQAKWKLKCFFQEFCESPSKGLRSLEKLMFDADTFTDNRARHSLAEKLHGYCLICLFIINFKNHIVMSIFFLISFMELGGMAKIKEMLKSCILSEDSTILHKWLKLLNNDNFPFDEELMINELNMVNFLNDLKNQHWINTYYNNGKQIDLIFKRWNKIIQNNKVDQVKRKKLVFMKMKIKKSRSIALYILQKMQLFKFHVQHKFHFKVEKNFCYFFLKKRKIK
ncbi:hypothetical protein RFI_25403 [Reticulomyxa filosa]|uniref:Uncharacterized protein n=1 Tax=Reticulomyxa filosa TaxID=46433 RepID=X6MEZ0_RETFI|nr:hypothetical protein RFI_25403 [Reticulomyxa filosa]|eukprot:ETO11972.1 hypothetical protein RFI_25403 [Reticulomyxa filosa]